VAPPNFVLSSFVGQSAQDKLNIFRSGDGVVWNVDAPNGYNPTGNATCASGGCVRDPSIAKFGSTWYVLHTCVSNNLDVHEFCLTNSNDDLHTFQSPATFVDTSSISATLSDLAPEWAKNPSGTPYLDAGGCPHAVFALSNKVNSFAIYETHPTNCSDFTQPWTTPVQLVVTGEGQIFDPMLVCRSASNGTCTGSGDEFDLWYCHIDLGVRQNVQWAKASSITGTYTRQSPGGDWINGGINQEGPMVIKLADRWRLYFDMVSFPPGNITDGEINYADSFDDLASFTNPHAIDSGATQAKHGTVIPYP
jgi:hypothetical protein